MILATVLTLILITVLLLAWLFKLTKEFIKYGSLKMVEQQSNVEFPVEKELEEPSIRKAA